MYLNIGDRLNLKLEPTNQFDENAIKVVDMKENHIGYLPRYYSESMTRYLRQGATYECVVVEVNKDMECHECINVKLEVYINVRQIEKII